MSWESEINELRYREELAKKMGGEERVARHRSQGKLPVREKIDKLLDTGSFHETGALAGTSIYEENGELIDFTPANFVMGTGRIDGRKVVIGADDFTVRGGAMDGAVTGKQIYAELMANELKLPIVRLVDGTGGGGSIKTLIENGDTYVTVLPGWDHVIDNLQKVPVAAICTGSVAGLGAARVSTSHFSVMIKDISQMFAAGPLIVKFGLGQDLTKEELGGTQVHGSNGVIDNIVNSEEEAFQQIRDFLSYLPKNVWELPPVSETSDDKNRRDENLISAIPKNRRKLYKIRKILPMIFDKDTLFEMGSTFGGSMITAFARLNGYPVGVIAPDVYKDGGAMTAESSEKLERFVDLCNTFHLPIVNLVDNPGLAVGLQAERKGTLRKGVSAIAAVYQAKIPICEIIIRRDFGVGGAGMSNAHGLNMRYAWPSGVWGSLPIEGGLEVAYKRDLEASDDPEALRAALLKKLEKTVSPFRTAEKFGIEEIIDPRDTRPLLCEWIKDAYELLPQQLGFKHYTYRP
jgi:acetyl-CoA carboxylase carboxyltransferase component